jgi:hypothetical protein
VQGQVYLSRLVEVALELNKDPEVNLQRAMQNASRTDETRKMLEDLRNVVVQKFNSGSPIRPVKLKRLHTSSVQSKE